MEIILSFVDGDFDSPYNIISECPITKALKRAGYPWLMDTGNAIKSNMYLNGDKSRGPRGTVIFGWMNKDYDLMRHWVLSVYEGRAGFKPSTFTITLSKGEEENFHAYYPNAETLEGYKTQLL